MGNFGWEIRKISPHSKTKMSIPPDVIRKAEMQMKRKAPDDLNGEQQHKTRSKKANAAASSSTSSLQFDYALEKQFRENSVAGFALTCVMHRERSAMKEALELLRECLDDDFTKISPMKMPCKAFAFLSVAEEKLQLELAEVVTRVVRIVLNRQNEVRFLERMIPIQTTCEYTDDAIERAVERLGITNQSNEFKTFAVCHRDCFSKALVAKEDTKDEMEKWKSMAVTNAVAKAVSKRIDKVSLKDPDVVIFVVVLAVNDNGIKNTDNIPTRRLGLSYATRESKVFTVKSKGIVATNLKP
jgi:tRNA(Ser,Leu) C12 N-acetylase TAN1